MSADVLIVGPSMSGKTVSAATFPKPMVFLDYDGNTASIFRTKDKTGKLVVDDSDKIHIISMVKSGTSALNFRTDLAAKTAPPHTKSSLEIFTRFNDVIGELGKGAGLFLDGPDKPPVEPRTLVIDSLTQMFTIWKEVVMTMNSVPNPRPADYLTMEGQMTGAFIPTMNSLLHEGILDFVILIAHTQIDKDETTGIIDEFPIGPSKNMGRNIGKYMDDVLYQKVEGDKRIWKTRPTGFFKYAGSRHNIPDGTEALYKNVEQYFK